MPLSSIQGGTDFANEDSLLLLSPKQSYFWWELKCDTCKRCESTCKCIKLSPRTPGFERWCSLQPFCHRGMFHASPEGTGEDVLVAVLIKTQPSFDT